MAALDRARGDRAGPRFLSTIRYNSAVAGTAAGQVLRDARVRAGLSQVELARRAGVTQSVVSAYESGARQPSLPTLQRLVQATGCELKVLVQEQSPREGRDRGS